MFSYESPPQARKNEGKKSNDSQGEQRKEGTIARAPSRGPLP